MRWGIIGMMGALSACAFDDRTDERAVLFCLDDKDCPGDRRCNTSSHGAGAGARSSARSPIP
jgi:hypothetical protein